MNQKESTFSMDGQVANNGTGLFYLTDEKGWYQNLIYVCGQPWMTKNLNQGEAVIYTEDQMKIAKYFFSKRKIRVFESEIIRKRKTWRKDEKAKNPIKESQQESQQISLVQVLDDMGVS